MIRFISIPATPIIDVFQLILEILIIGNSLFREWWRGHGLIAG
jgi:hypothetical protein